MAKAARVAQVAPAQEAARVVQVAQVDPAREAARVAQVASAAAPGRASGRPNYWATEDAATNRSGGHTHKGPRARAAEALGEEVAADVWEEGASRGTRALGRRVGCRRAASRATTAP